MIDIEAIAAKAQAVCKMQGWDRTWRGGTFLFLESAEFIEALRGKGDETPASEAADVLFVLFSILRAYDIPTEEVLTILDKRCDDILAGRRTFPNRDIEVEEAVEQAP